MNTDKSICVFTNFWDANYLIDKIKYIVFEHKNNVYRVNLIPLSDKEKSNFSVHSIALSSPKLTKLPYLKGMQKLDFFCPTYDMLRRYHADHDWTKYSKDFHALMMRRNNDLKEWLNGLVINHIYMLCCWENTSKGAHCHRELLYNAMLKSPNAIKKVIPLYRHGDSKQDKAYIRELNPYNYGLSNNDGVVNEAINRVVNGMRISVSSAVSHGSPSPSTSTPSSSNW